MCVMSCLNSLNSSSNLDVGDALKFLNLKLDTLNKQKLSYKVDKKKLKLMLNNKKRLTSREVGKVTCSTSKCAARQRAIKRAG